MMFEDAAAVDPSVVAELPAELRATLEKQLEMAALSSKKRPSDEESSSGTAQRQQPEKKKKYRQAKETSASVEVLCFKCRREPGKARQQTLSFLPTTTKKGADEPMCARCRMPLAAKKKTQRKKVTVPPQMTRLKGYKRLAADSGVPFALTDSEAFALMRGTCFGCGKAGGEDGNGISRLRDWTGFSDEEKRRARKSFMGPFSRQNCITACAACNLMKGARSVRSFVEACRTIATHRNLGDFGRYPSRFRDNTSRRSRSSYITKSSTHTKTHSLTNAQFAAIVAQPCAYCGKPPSKTHHNGLDRLDSDDRVYRLDAVVSCCGDCNVMKYKHDLDVFLAHCLVVATFHHDTVFPDTDDDASHDRQEKDDEEKDDLGIIVAEEEDEEEARSDDEREPPAAEADSSSCIPLHRA